MSLVDVSDEVEFKNGKGNPFGWSVENIYHLGSRIGQIYCGEPKIDAANYSLTLTKESETVTRCRIFYDNKNGDIEVLRDAVGFRSTK